MMRLAEIQAHIGGMSELRDIVGAMRSLAAMRVQEAEHALCGIRRYAEMMLAAIGAGLLLVPEPAAGTHPERRRRALILCMSELGFVGEFNTRLADAAKAAFESEDQLFILGSRGAELASEHGLQIAWSAPIATRPRGAPETVHVLADELYRRIAQSGISRVEAMFGRHSGGVPAVQRQLLLPLDLAAFAAIQRGHPPLHNLAPRVLLEELTAEYVSARLTDAVVESIAAENAARFAAMDSAHDNVAKKLAQLHRSAHLARQDEITTELLDLITGAEAQASE